MRGSRLRSMVFRAPVGSFEFLSHRSPLPLLFLLLVFQSAGATAAAEPAPGTDPSCLISTYPLWSLEGEQAEAWFGRCVATAGDVNGDGYSDLIVGAPRWDSAYIDEGAAFLYLGSPSGPASEPAWFVEGHQTGARLGLSVAPAGDVNGDGYADVIIGAPLHDAGSGDQGRAWVYLGSPSGLSPSPIWTKDGTQSTELFGHSVAPAGDVNGDGYDDILVGSPGFDVTQDGAQQGKAFLFPGTGSGVADSPAWSVAGDVLNAQLGTSVSTAGDVNGDGYADVIIGAPYYGMVAPSTGRAWVYLGSATGLATTAIWTQGGTAAYDGFGMSVATAGDINGDGYSDVIVGAPWADTTGGPGDDGRAYLYRGMATGVSSTPLWSAGGMQAGAAFGICVAPAGDVNGDSFADVVVGAHGWDGGQTNEGKVFLYEGSVAGLPTNPDWVRESDFVGAMAGLGTATAGDVNGDGLSDVAIGASCLTNPDSEEGAVWVYAGQADGLSNAPVWQRPGDQQETYLGNTVAAAGDVNGDGFTDVVIDSPNYDTTTIPDAGRAWAYLGSPSGPGSTAQWVGSGDQSGANYGVGLAAAGDVNGDGYGDLLVSSDSYDGSAGANVGRVDLYRGSSTGLDATPAWTQFGDQGGMRFGVSVAGAGDVNGDGYADVIVGAPMFTGPQSHEGKVFVYHGSPSGLGGTPAWTEQGNSEGIWFGWSVAGAGDVNGDGYSDVIIGAPGHLIPGGGPGRAFVYLGGPSGLASSPAWTGSLDTAYDYFGISVSTAGDVNGDGFDDVIVGAPGYSVLHPGGGLVSVYMGSAAGLSPNIAWMSFGVLEEEHRGGEVTFAGDVNSDGFGDIAFSSSTNDSAGVLEGAVRVKLGSAAGLSGGTEWLQVGSMELAQFGYSIKGAGDTNGDGYDDLIIGAPGHDANGLNRSGMAFVYLGNDRGLSHQGRPVAARQQQSSDQAPIDLLGLSDSESSFGLACTGRSPAGRIRVRPEWQASRFGVPLGSEPLQKGTWILTGPPAAGSGSEAALITTATGLPAAAPCHWRMRIGGRSPYFPCSPWMSTAGTVPSQKQLRMGNVVDGIAEGAVGRGSSLRLESVRPNPFRRTTVLEYSVPASGEVRVTIHDVTGRQVRTLVDQAGSPGRHAVTWDGRDDGGRSLPLGVYLVRVESRGEVTVGRMVRGPVEPVGR